MRSTDALWRVVTTDGHQRLLLVEASDVVRQMASAHELRGAAARLAGELAIANVLMSAWIKGDERLSLQLQSERPRASFMGEIDAEGAFRGRFSPVAVPEADTVRGLLLAIKSDASSELYRGITEIADESVTVALQRHLTQSDQLGARVGIEVVLEGDEVVAAHGVLIERLPGGSSDDLDLLAGIIDELPWTEVLACVEAGQMLAFDLTLLDERPLAWRCRCDVERVRMMLRSLGPQELHAMIAEDHGAAVACHFCATVYRFDEAELGSLLLSSHAAEA
jgi:molecular chaperone Hsp33